MHYVETTVPSSQVAYAVHFAHGAKLHTTFALKIGKPDFPASICLAIQF